MVVNETLGKYCNKWHMMIPEFLITRHGCILVILCPVLQDGLCMSVTSRVVFI